MNLYHFVPENLVGSILYPLNELEQKFPEQFEQHNKKYIGREEVKAENIPNLGKWNDALHLSPIDPSEVIFELKKAGVKINWEWRVFVIDGDKLDWSKMKIMHKSQNKDGSFKTHFEDFNQASYDSNCHLPEHTKQHYRDSVAKKELPFNFAAAPHVFYKGKLDTSKLEIKTYH